MVPYQNHGIHKSISGPGPLSVSPFQVTRVSFSWREQKSLSQSPSLYECKHGHMLPTPSSDRDKGWGILHQIWLVGIHHPERNLLPCFPLSNFFSLRTENSAFPASGRNNGAASLGQMSPFPATALQRCALPGFFSFFLSFFVFSFIFISWRLITLQCCSGFCHTLTWISHGFTCVPHPLSEERCHRPSLYPPCKGLLTLKSSHVSSPLDVERKGEITQ